MSDDSGRPALGGWLYGPGGPKEPTQDFPGQRLGRPEHGPGSAAPMMRRVLALLVDWLLAMLVGGLLVPTLISLGPLLVFGVVQVLLVGTVGFSVGHRVMGLEVTRLDSRPLGPVGALVRTALLLLVLPAVISDEDGRGLHDRAAGSIVVRR